MPKFLYVDMVCCCEKLMNKEVVFCWNLNGFMINCCWWCCENMLLVNWCNDYALWWIDDESCCCCWIIMEVWWIIEFLTKWCFDLEFWVSFGMCSCIWPINIIWDVFWVWEDQNWSVWEKGFWNSKFFFLNTWVFA